MSERVLIKTAVDISCCQLVADGRDTKKLLHILISIVVAVWEPRFSSHRQLQLLCIYELELKSPGDSSSMNHSALRARAAGQGDHGVVGAAACPRHACPRVRVGVVLQHGVGEGLHVARHVVAAAHQAGGVGHHHHGGGEAGLGQGGAGHPAGPAQHQHLHCNTRH